MVFKVCELVDQLSEVQNPRTAVACECDYSTNITQLNNRNVILDCIRITLPTLP
jgi:hypothetical protein